jgi:DNA-binding transcriptional LysR family regulator
MKKTYHVDLTPEERDRLLDIVKRRKSSSEAVKRSQILLAADRQGDKSWKDSLIATEHRVNVRTVERLRERFVMHGLDLALSGMPRPNLDKVRFEGKVEANLVAVRCSDPPEGRNSWTLELLADKLVSLQVVESISRQSVSTILKKMNLSLGG